MTVSIHYSIAEISEICKTKWIKENQHLTQPEFLCLDSRRINAPEKTIFFALKNRQQNATQFIKGLYQKGVRHFLIDDSDFSIKNVPLANVLFVSDVVNALQDLAIHHRNQFQKLPVIGITGSNGKTVVKEWLNQLLQNTASIVRSPKSYNSQIGVPISILNIRPQHTLGIFEAGISLVDEMAKLEKIIQPKIGILTNIGTAHDEGFLNKTQKLREKLELFKNAKVLIFCANDIWIKNEVLAFQKENQGLKLFQWGENEDCHFRITTIKKNVFIEDSDQGKSSHTNIEGIAFGKSYSISIPFSDDASVENAIQCLCLLIFRDVAIPEMLQRFEKLEPVAMRLEIKPGINRCTILNDSYSNDLHSLSIALDFLRQQKNHPKKTVILSDISQSGMESEQLYKQVATLLQHHHIDTLIGIGPEIQKHQSIFSAIKNPVFYSQTDHFLKEIQLHHFNDESILIKGARKFEFEKISHLLENKVHQTVLSINLNSLVYNLKKYREILKPATKIMAMVKAFSYGTGSHEIASVLEYNKVDYLAVAYADEGVELRKAGISLPIMVMNIDETTFEAIVNHNLEPEIFSFRILHAFEHYLQVNDIEKYPVHLKIDTGMHRLGFLEHEIDELSSLLNLNKFIQVNSVFTHLAASDEESKDEFTFQQYDIFIRCTNAIEDKIGYTFLRHIANTTAISRLPQLQMDMVRLGIGLYGIDSNEKMQAQLQNVSVLKTTISQIRKVPAEETIGYGRHGKLLQDSTIATVRLGYADGYPRSLGNGRGKMLVACKLAPVIGNVCMDMIMLDITGLENIQEGDDVIVFGENPSLPMLAVWAGTIPYEIMTGISQRVKRVYFEE
ncbi:MAG: bifunctional UDP-N-acetylmuramoyl-tripeptide:D-alanyl-D-alanine ligase/alanine racemase [Ginsengibacter sp.]